MVNLTHWTSQTLAALSFSTSLLQRFTAESSRALRRNVPWGNKQRQVSMFLILIFKLLTQFPFVSFLSISILSLLLFSILSVLPLHHPFFLFWSVLCLLHSVHQWHIFYLFLIMHSISLKKTNFLCLSSNLSYPEDLKKQWLPFSILSLPPFLISPSLSSIPSCSSDQFSVLLRQTLHVSFS